MAFPIIIRNLSLEPFAANVKGTDGKTVYDNGKAVKEFVHAVKSWSYPNGSYFAMFQLTSVDSPAMAFRCQTKSRDIASALVALSGQDVIIETKDEASKDDKTQKTFWNKVIVRVYPVNNWKKENTGHAVDFTDPLAKFSAPHGSPSTTQHQEVMEDQDAL